MSLASASIERPVGGEPGKAWVERDEVVHSRERGGWCSMAWNEERNGWRGLLCFVWGVGGLFGDGGGLNVVELGEPGME